MVLGATAGSKPWPPGRCLPTGRDGRGEGKEFGTGVILLVIKASKLSNPRTNARVSKKTKYGMQWPEN